MQCSDRHSYITSEDRLQALSRFVVEMSKPNGLHELTLHLPESCRVKLKAAGSRNFEKRKAAIHSIQEELKQGVYRFSAFDEFPTNIEAKI